MALTRVTYSMIEGAQANVLDYGAVGDGVADVQATQTSGVNQNILYVYLKIGA